MLTVSCAQSVAISPNFKFKIDPLQINCQNFTMSCVSL